MNNVVNKICFWILRSCVFTLSGVVQHFKVLLLFLFFLHTYIWMWCHFSKLCSTFSGFHVNVTIVKFIQLLVLDRVWKSYHFLVLFVSMPRLGRFTFCPVHQYGVRNEGKIKNVIVVTRTASEDTCSCDTCFKGYLHFGEIFCHFLLCLGQKVKGNLLRRTQTFLSIPYSIQSYEKVWALDML